MVNFFEVNPGAKRPESWKRAFFNGREIRTEKELFDAIQATDYKEKTYTIEDRFQKSVLWFVEYVGKHHYNEIHKLKVVVRGSRVVCVRFGRWISDLSALFPSKSAHQIGLMTPFQKKNPADRWERANWIVSQLWSVSGQFRKTPPNTIGALALAWFLYTVDGTENNPWFANRIREPKGVGFKGKEDITGTVRAALAGGRVEMYEKCATNYYIFDENSEYLAAMHGLQVPWKKPYRPNRRLWSALIENPSAFGFADVSVEIWSDDSPALWLHTIDRGLIFPVGSFRGIYPLNELQHALSTGTYRIKQIHDVLLFKPAQPFNRFVDEVWTLRQQAKAEGNKFLEMLAKMTGAQLHGKLGTKNLTSEFFFAKRPKGQLVRELPSPWKQVKMYTGTKKFYTPYQKPEASAYIAAQARIDLHKALKTYKPIYCDTDSIHTREMMPEHGKGLGEWKLEHEVERGSYSAPKNYTFHDANGVEWKVAGGIPRDENGALMEHWQQCTFKDLLMSGVAQAKEIFRGHLRAVTGSGARIFEEGSNRSHPPSIDHHNLVKVGQKHYARLVTGGKA